MEEKEIKDPKTTTESNTEVQNDTAAKPENEDVQAEQTEENLTDADKLAQQEAEIAELKDKLLRQAADYANFRKHAMARQTELILNGGKNVIESLLPILDDIERAEANLNKEDKNEGLSEGIRLVFKKLNDTLQKQGLERMDVKDKTFDTDFHEAVALFPTQDESQKNQIIDCVQTGYMLSGKVLRHAKVVVAQ